MITLGISILGLAALVGLKWWELRSRRILFYGIRRRITIATHAVISGIFSLIPVVLSKTVVVLLKRVRAAFRSTLASFLLWLEGFLERTLHIVRHKTDPTRGGGAASPFLQEVAEYKKQLSRPKKLR